MTYGGLAQSVERVLCKHEAPRSKLGFSILLVIKRDSMAEWLRR